MNERVISAATQKLLRTAVDTQKTADEQDIFALSMPLAVGTLMSYMQSMWERLPEDDWLKENLEAKLAEAAEEIEQDFVMRKMKQK